MIASSGGDVDLARLLLDLLVVLAATKLFAELAERVRVPAVIGEILAGVVVGPSVLGWVVLDDVRGVSIAVLAEIGVLLLLLQVGMEMDVRELARVGTSSLLVAVIGVAAPFAGGFAVASAFGTATDTAVFMGAALTATSVGITARVLGDLRALATTEARIVLGAAVADDVLGLVILTVVVKVVGGGSVGPGTIASTLGLAVLFLLATGVVGLLGVPRLLDAVHRRASSPATVTVVAAIVMIGFAELADAANLAFIIGAFMAGLGVGASRHHERVARDLGAVGQLFIPVFFAVIGINADLEAMTEPSVLGIAAALTAVAVAGKLLSSIGIVRTKADRLLVGIGMIPRGEVGLIFAAIGLSNAVLDEEQYGALLIVVLVTTIVAPPLLRWRIGRPPAEPVDEVVEEPDGGWLTVRDGEVALRGEPPAAATVSIALDAASLVREGRLSAGLLDWFARHRGAPLTWDPALTPRLVRLLRADDPRAWRLLDVTGVLERALPEVAETMDRRRADIGDLDPIGALRFPVVERVDALGAERGEEPGEDLLLAAFVADVADDLDDDRAGRRLAARLVSDAAADRIMGAIADAHRVREGVHAPMAADELQLEQLAIRLTTAALAREVGALALALGPLQTWQQEVIAERIDQVVASLSDPR